MASMETNCKICNTAKAPYVCGLCEHSVCKRCVEKHPKGSFHYLQAIPESLQHKLYCMECYSRTVVPALTRYEETLARAKGLFVFHKGQSQETRLYSRSEKPLRVENCDDRNEVLLRLAYLAASADFNTLLDVEILPEKIRNGGFERRMWSAQGTPTNLDGDALRKKEHAAIHKTFLSSY